MDGCDKLVQILERLLAPDGCPWDREQTLQSMRRSLLEEAYEVIEAIDLDDNQKMEEELGDLLFNVFFLCKLGEKEGRFTLSDVLEKVSDKLIRRHPHIFGDAKVADSAEVLRQWEELKQAEKGKQHKKSVLDEIPKDLPSLARAQKMLSKFKKAGYSYLTKQETSIENEGQLGAALLHLIAESKQKGLDPEHALQKALTHLGADFRKWESNSL